MSGKDLKKRGLARSSSSLSVASGHSGQVESSACQKMRIETDKILRWKRDRQSEMDSIEREINLLEGVCSSNKLKLSSKKKQREQQAIQLASKNEDEAKMEARLQEASHLVQMDADLLHKFNDEVKMFAKMRDAVDERIKEKQNEVDRLSMQLADLQLKADNKIKEGEAVLAKVQADSQVEEDKLKIDEEAVNSVLNTCQQQYDQVEAQDNLVKSKLEDAEHLLQHKEQDYNQLVQEIEDIRARNKENIVTNRETVEACKIEFDEAKKNLEGLKHKQSRQKEILKELNLKHAQIEEDLDVSRANRDKIHKEKEIIQGEFRKLSLLLNDIQNKLQDCKVEKESLAHSTKALSKLTLDVRMAKEDLQHSNLSNQTLESELRNQDEVKTNIENLERKKTELENSLETMRSDNHETLCSYEAEQKRIREDILTILPNLERNKMNTMKEIDELNYSNKQSNHEKLSIKNKIKDAEEDCKIKSDKISALKRQVEESSAKVEKIRGRFESLTQQINLAEEKSVEVRHNLQTVIEETSRRVEQSELSKQAIIDSINLVKSQINTKRDEISSGEEQSYQLDLDTSEVNKKSSMLDQLKEKESVIKVQIINLATRHQDAMACVDHLDSELTSWNTRLAGLTRTEEDKQRLVKERNRARLEKANLERKKKESDLRMEEVGLEEADADRQLEEALLRLQLSKAEASQKIEKLEFRMKQETQRVRKEVGDVHMKIKDAEKETKMVNKQYNHIQMNAKNFAAKIQREKQERARKALAEKARAEKEARAAKAKAEKAAIAAKKQAEKEAQVAAAKAKAEKEARAAAAKAMAEKEAQAAADKAKAEKEAQAAAVKAMVDKEIEESAANAMVKEEILSLPARARAEKDNFATARRELFQQQGSTNRINEQLKPSFHDADTDEEEEVSKSEYSKSFSNVNSSGRIYPSQLMYATPVNPVLHSSQVVPPQKATPLGDAWRRGTPRSAVLPPSRKAVRDVFSSEEDTLPPPTSVSSNSRRKGFLEKRSLKDQPKKSAGGVTKTSRKYQHGNMAGSSKLSPSAKIFRNANRFSPVGNLLASTPAKKSVRFDSPETGKLPDSDDFRTPVDKGQRLSSYLDRKTMASTKTLVGSRTMVNSRTLASTRTVQSGTKPSFKGYDAFSSSDSDF